MAKQWSRYRVDPEQVQLPRRPDRQHPVERRRNRLRSSTGHDRRTRPPHRCTTTPRTNPTPPSLAAYPGDGDACSSYGNRNFFYLFPKILRLHRRRQTRPQRRQSAGVGHRPATSPSRTTPTSPGRGRPDHHRPHPGGRHRPGRRIRRPRPALRVGRRRQRRRTEQRLRPRRRRLQLLRQRDRLRLLRSDRLRDGASRLHRPGQLRHPTSRRRSRPLGARRNPATSSASPATSRSTSAPSTASRYILEASWVGTPIHVVPLTRTDYDPELHRYWS